MSDLVKTYNPANATTLTPEQVDAMQRLSSDEIKELAKAYPNGAHSRAYLLIIDQRKPADKQLPSLSTFQNLWNLREKNGLKNYVAYRFRDNVKPLAASPTRTGRGVLPKGKTVVDLSDVDLLSLPGFKTGDKEHPAQSVPVKKIGEPMTVTNVAEPVEKPAPKKRGPKPKVKSETK